MKHCRSCYLRFKIIQSEYIKKAMPDGVAFLQSWIVGIYSLFKDFSESTRLNIKIKKAEPEI